MTTTDPGAWVLVAPRRAAGQLRDLATVHARQRDVLVLEREAVPHPAEWPALVPAGAAGVLVVGDRRRSPGTVTEGPFVTAADGDRVAAGWLPGARYLAGFVAAATEVASRSADGPVAVLGQRTPRYQGLAGRLAHHLGDVDAVRWGAERVTREDLVAGLSTGLGTAVYLGHGRPSGWAAYRGLRAEHLLPLGARPLGCLASVTCWTASRRGVGTSFSEQVVLQGSAAAALGAVRPTLHLDNARVVLGLARALRAGAATPADLLRAALLDEGRPTPEAAGYRLCGDPLASLACEPGAAEVAHRLVAPAPDAAPLERTA